MSIMDRENEWALANVDGLSRRAFMERALYAGATVAVASTAWSKHAAAAPSKGGDLVVAATGGATTDVFSPLQALGSDHPTQAMLCCYDTLTEIDSTGAPVPSLAESWEVSADGRTWTFKLRDGVEFHDGKSLTAADVVWSLNRHLSDDGVFAEGKQIVRNFESLSADGDTVVMVQKEVNFDLPVHLSSFGLIIGKEGVEDWDAGVGTGPYVMEAFEPGVRFMGRKFENFYRDDQGHFDSVELLNIADVAARTSALQTGEVQVIGDPDTKTAAMLARVPGISLLEAPGTQHYTTAMRVDMDPFMDNNVRLAIKYGIKRQEIVDKIFGGYGYVGNDIPIGRGQQFYNSDLPQREFDPDRARFHLKEAGLDSLDVTLSTSDGAFNGAVDMGVLMRESMSEAGINVNVKREPADGYWSDVWLKAPWCAVYWNGRPTIDWMLSSTYISSSEWNDTRFKSERFDSLLSMARAESNEDDRRAMYFEAQEILHNQGGTTVLAFTNFMMAKSDKMGHGPVGVSRRMDDSRLARRWWFAA
jgi:peptide/nickel transport system substrate-binding protein